MSVLAHPRDDTELFLAAQAGDEAAWASVAERHGPALLSFCRHMLGSRQDAEDAVQHVLLDAFRALRRGDRPEHPRGWLFAIARNRCTSMLRARRPVAAGEDLELVATDGLSAEVERREDLRQLVADVQRLPEDQRAALLLAELHDDSHADIATALGVPTKKVKALVFQARSSLVADREARSVACGEIREQLATLTGSARRVRVLRRHVATCDACAAYERELGRRRGDLRAILPVAPLVPFTGVLATGGAVGAGTAGVVATGIAGKVAATLAVGAVAVGGVAVVAERPDRDAPVRERAAQPTQAAPVAEQTAASTATGAPVRVVEAAETTTSRPARRTRSPRTTNRRPASATATPVPAATTVPATRTPAATAAPGRSGGSNGGSSTAPGQTKDPGTPATGRGQGQGSGTTTGRATAPGQVKVPESAATGKGQQDSGVTTGRDSAPGRQK